MTSAEAVAAMLAARSVAVVGASPRPGSFGARMVNEVMRGAQRRRVHFVNPRYDRIGEQACLPSLSELDSPVDLVLLGVGDDALVGSLTDAAAAGARSAVIYGSALREGQRAEVTRIAAHAAMAVCGGGCMGFVNVPERLRAIGYEERAELPEGPVSIVTHSGSVFSALLRTHRALGFSLAISSGQELVTTTADYLDYVLDRTATTVIGLVLETMRDGPRLVECLRRAADRDVAVVVMPAGASPLGARLVTAHSGALAGGRAGWEALTEVTGARLAADLGELTDTLELLAVGRRPRRRGGLATVHDSGAERALVADVAHALGVTFAPLADETVRRLKVLLEPGLAAANPLDVWGTGAGARELLRDSLLAMAADPNVAATALAVDLVPEYDGDTSYIDAALDAAQRTDAPLAVLTNLPSAVDQGAAGRLRAAGVPVLEGTRSGLAALGHLIGAGAPAWPGTATDLARLHRWRTRLDGGRPVGGAEALALLADYGIPAPATRACAGEQAAVVAAQEIGYPVVLKTDEPHIAHRSDVGGVRIGLAGEAELRDAYRDLAGRLGGRVTVSALVAPGAELALGIVRDPQLGPLVMVAAGGVFTELLADRAVVLPPLDEARARRMLDRLRIRPLLDGARGMPPAALDAVAAAIVNLGQLAVELGDHLDALDVNPIIAGPERAVAVDALVVAATAGPQKGGEAAWSA